MSTLLWVRRRSWQLVLTGLLLLTLGGCGRAADTDRAAFAFPTPTPTPFGFLAGTPQPGGVWTRALTTNPENFNPILAADRASLAVHRLLYPTLVRQDPTTGQYGATNAMAERWEVSPDGRSWTFYLRPGVTWSDGDPVDAADFKFTYDAMRIDGVDSPYRRLVEPIEAIEVVNPFTVRVLLTEARCDVLSLLHVGWMPSHRFAADFSDVVSNFFNQQPDVSAGPFIFQSWIPDENVVLQRNNRYWQGAPLMERMVFRIVPDAEDRLNQLIAGELDETVLNPDQLTSLIGIPAIKMMNASVDAYDFLALNLANPAAPQRGLSEQGAFLFQDPHPILADRVVREAMSYAIDYRGIVSAIYLGQAYPLAANVLPIIPWAFDASLEAPVYSPDRARALLEGDGWIDTNRNGIREKDIRSLRLTLSVPASNPFYARIADTIKNQLNAVGFDIVVRSLDTAPFTQELLGQRFDLALSGWTGLGIDPDDHQLWEAAFDRPGSGFNFVSYQNARLETLLAQGRTTPGCQQQDRAPIYREIQQTLAADLPYIFLAGIVETTAYQERWGNVDPGPWDFYHNVHTWYRFP